MSSKFGVGGDVTASWQDDLMGEIRSHSGVGLAFQGGKLEGNPGSTNPTKPIIYIVDMTINAHINLTKMVSHMQDILALNEMADMFDISVINEKTASALNNTMALRTCDSMHSIRDGGNLMDRHSGNTTPDPFDSGPSFTSNYTNVSKCKDIDELLKSTNINSSLEYAVALINIHELSHQYITRMYSYLYGIKPIHPKWLDFYGHDNNSPNLL
ncbi:MAG: hypothetical protein IPP69_02870 [Flavobacteriales bacterium]|nr:hypothetical protein [Flavobacteriales bacterium]